MSHKPKKDFSVAQAVGRGDWKKVIELERGALVGAQHKQFNYSMIGYAYEKLKDYESSKNYYGTALAHDACCEHALEGLARAYASEKNHDLAYQYVLKGLHQTKDDNFRVPKTIKLLVAVVIKVLRPSRPFSKIRSYTNSMDQTRNEWVTWALKYKEWYEKNIDDEAKPKLH